MMAGDDEYAKAVWRGREAIGLMTVASAMIAAASGVLTGNGPADRKRKDEWLKTHQPRSIRSVNTWVKVDHR